MSAVRTEPPAGLQLDLLTAIVRLEQIRDECFDDEGLTPFGEDLLLSRVIECDVPRLRAHLTAETLAWEAETDGV